MATAAPVQPAASQRGIWALLARHPLTFYFIIAFAGTWLTELPYVSPNMVPGSCNSVALC